MKTPDRDAFLQQTITQHPAGRKRKLHVQFVDPAHDRQIGGRYRPGQVIDAATAHPQFLGLPDKWQRVGTVDHRFALGNSPAFPSAPAKKSFTSVNSPILACSVFTSIAGSAASAVVLPAPKTPAAPFSNGVAKSDLVRVYIELLRQLRQRLLALHGSQCHLRLECWTVVPARSSAHLIFCHAATVAAVRQKTHLSRCAVLPGHLSSWPVVYGNRDRWGCCHRKGSGY